MRKTIAMLGIAAPLVAAGIAVLWVLTSGVNNEVRAEAPDDGLVNHEALTIEPETSALVLIEFQKEWLGEEGKLVRLFDDPERSTNAARQARRALEAARGAGMNVIHAPMVLSPGYPELGEGRFGLRAAIPEAGTWIGAGADFASGFEPAPGEPVVEGRVGASAFVGSNLEAILEQRGIQTLYLAGFATHVCVESTLRHGHDLGYDVVVLRDASAAFTDVQEAYFDEHVLDHFGHPLDVNGFVKKAAR